MQTSRSLKNNFNPTFRKTFAALSLSLLASSNLTTAALANNQGGVNAFQQFALNNPGVTDHKQLQQMFHVYKDTNAHAANVQNAIHNNVQNNGNHANNLNRNDFASKAEWQAAKQALHIQNKNLNDTINQTIQQTANNQIVRANQGFALDLGSAIENITLGDKLFQNQTSVAINVGGQEKTVSAGSKVTAAEYVAAKQELASGAQTVTLDASGRATGGVVDLSAMTTGNKTMKVTDLVVPVAVTASGEFGKGGDVKILGDLTNNGTITALAAGNPNNATASIKAENITNNTGASINSQISDLGLYANNNLSNYGDINASGNLTLSAGNTLTNSGTVHVAHDLNVLAPNVSNTGHLTSTAGDVTFDTPVAAAMNINNINGVVSASGAINIREAGYNAAFDSNVSGGDLLSKELNVNTGGGTANVFVNKLTGTVNSVGNGAHISANTDVLTIGNQCLTGDPTYYNTGFILLNGDVTAGEAISIIAGTDILANSNCTQITARDGAGQGYNINIVAGANIIAGTGETGPFPGIGGIVPGFGTATSTVTISGGTTAGGAVNLSGAASNLTINSNSTGTNLNGGNIQIVAYQGTSNTSGVISLPTTSTINAGSTLNNGSISIFGGTSVALGTVTTTGGGGIGRIDIQNINPIFSSGSTMDFGTNGQITSGNRFRSDPFPSIWGTGDVTIASLASSSNVSFPNTIRSGHNLTIGSINTNGPTEVNAGNANSGNIDLNVTGPVVSPNGINLSATGNVTAQSITAVTGAISVGSNNGNVNITTVSGDLISINAGKSVTTSDLSAVTTVGIFANQNVTVGNVNAGSISITAGPTQLPAANGHIVTGNLSAGDISLLTPYGDVTVNGVINAQGTFTLQVFGDVTQAALGGGVLTAAGGVDLTSTIGSIGSASTALLISATEIAAAANNGSVYINDVINLPTVQVDDVTGNTVQITRTNPGVFGGITVAGQIGANNVTLTNAGADGDITISGSIRGLGGGFANSVTLVGSGNGRINGIGGSNIDTLNLTATTGAGDIVITRTTARSINATTTTNGNVLITDYSPTAVTLNSIANGNNIDIELMTPNVDLIVAGPMHAASNLTLGTNQGGGTGSIIRTGAGTVLDATSINLNSGGNIGSNTAAILTNTNFLTAHAGITNNVFVSDSGDVQLNDVQGNIVNISAFGTITQNNAAQITANTLSLSSTSGSIGALFGGAIKTNATNLSATAFGDVNLSVTNGLVQVGTLSGQTVQLTNTVGKINLQQDVTGTISVTINTTGGNPNSITQAAGKSIFTPSLTITATDGDIGTASNAIRTTAGDLTASASGNAFLSTTGDVSLNASDGQIFKLTSGGSITVQGVLQATNLTLTTTNSGNINLDSSITGAISPVAASVVLTANGTGTINQQLGTSITTQSLSLNSDSGNIGSNSSPIKVDNAIPTVALSVHTTGDWFVSAPNSFVNFGASSGSSGTLVAGNGVSTTGNTTLTGTLDIETGNINVQGDKLAADIINIHGFPGADLTIDGGIAGGVFSSTTQTNWTTTGGGNIFLSGKMTMNGPTFVNSTSAGQITINGGASYIGNNLVKLTSGVVNQIGFISGNPLVYDLLGNTIVNTTGDINFSDNIIFVGENFAVLASGNINFSPASTVRLANSAGDAGNLTLVAGYNISPATVGQIRSISPYTLGSASASGGSINMGGTTFDLTGSNNGGSFTAVAQGQAGGNAGTVSLGSISTSGANLGGSVTIFGSGGINVGAINTSGGSASGSVALNVMNSQIVGGNIVLTNGTRSGIGQFVSNGTSNGNLSFASITATGAQVTLTGAKGAVDTLNGTGNIQADTLTLQTGTGVATVGNTQVNTLNSNGDATVSLANNANLVLGSVSGAGQKLTITATGSITSTGFDVDTANLTGTASSGNAAINITNAIATTSASLKSLGGGDIVGGISTNALTLNSTGKVGTNGSTRFSTDAATIKVDAVNAFLNDTNAGGVAFNSGVVSGTFDVLATGVVTGGTITTSSALINAAGIGTGTGANAFTLTNGANPFSLKVTTGTGDSFIKDNGTGVVQIVGGSSGNGFSLETGTGASVATTGDITFGGDINITTNSMTNFFNVASSGGNINIQSNAGSNLQIFGAAGPTPATYSAGGVNGAINFTTNGTLIDISGKTTYLTTANLIANVSGQSVFLESGSISTATVPSFIYTAAVNGTGALTGPWNIVNSGTYANNGGNVTLGSITFNGADIAIIASGNINLGSSTINLSGNNGGNLTMLAGFNFSPNTSGQVNQDTATKFFNFTPTSSGSITGNVTINLNGAAGNGGRMIALANGGSVSLGNVSTTGTVTGGDVTIIASNGITAGAITTTAPTGGSVNLIVGNPTVGSGTNFEILGGKIIAGANTIGNSGLNNGSINVGPVADGNGSFAAQTSTTGSITLQTGLSARNITLSTGALNLLGFSTIAAGTDGNGKAGQIIIGANAVSTPTSHLQVTAIGTSIGDGGSIQFAWNSASPVSLGTGASDKFDFQVNASGTGSGGAVNFTTQGDVTLNAGALVGNSTAASAGSAVVTTNGNLTVNTGSINVGGTAGKGADIELTAGAIDNVGTLNLADTSFFTQANGTGAAGNGGTLLLSGSNITYAATSAASPLALTATGSGTGDGGTVIFQTRDTTATFVGNPARAPRSPFHFITAEAHGGGNGGTIDIETGGNLTISDASLINATGGSTGTLKGANYTFAAGKAATGTLIITGSLNADGVGGGTGGLISLSSNSTSNFTVGVANPRNGITGTLSGEEIRLTNNSAGIQLQNAASLTAQKMTLSAAGKGTITATGTLTAAQSIVLTATGGAIGGKAAFAVNTADLTVNTAGLVSVANSFAGSSVLENSTGGAGFTLHTAGSTTLNNITTTKGSITIVESSGALKTANGSQLSANNGALVLQNTNAAGTIAIGDNSQVATLQKGSSVSIVIGATIPKTGTNPFPPAPAGVNVTVDSTKNFVWFGPNNAVSVPTGTATVHSKGQNVLFNGLAAATITLGSGSLVLADPPTGGGGASAAAAISNVAAAIPSAESNTNRASLSQIFGFASNNMNATADLSVLSMNAAPQLQASSNASLMTVGNVVGNNANAFAAGNSVAGNVAATNAILHGNQRGVSNSFSSDDDNSYAVGFCPMAGETEAAICSDAELGLTDFLAGSAAHASIQEVAHADHVVLKSGNVLFVPLKATTVETPNGIVHIDAKAVALVSTSDTGLAVYDIEDQHKGSVSVESNGHNQVLSPGRHVMITKHVTAEFGQVNAVETIAHRNLQSIVKNGYRAHTSEFSVLTAMDTVKPLKAMAMSNHPQAKHIADRMMKTTAILLQLGGNGGQYQHYFKPRMTAMQ